MFRLRFVYTYLVIVTIVVCSKIVIMTKYYLCPRLREPDTCRNFLKKQGVFCAYLDSVHIGQVALKYLYRNFKSSNGLGVLKITFQFSRKRLFRETGRKVLQCKSLAG